MKKILIIGGGYGGLRCAKKLEKLLHKGEADVTLVSRHDYHYQTTLLHKVACGTYNPRKARIFYRNVLKNVHFVRDNIDRIDFEGKKAVGQLGIYNYDYLVISLGFEVKDFGVPGVKEHAFWLGSVNKALKLDRQIEEKFKYFIFDGKEDDLKFAVVGSGFTGVEFAAELAIRGKELCKIRGIDPARFSVSLIGRGERILPMFPPKLSEIARQKLEKLGVNVVRGDAVECCEDGVVVKMSDEDASQIYGKYNAEESAFEGIHCNLVDVYRDMLEKQKEKDGEVAGGETDKKASENSTTNSDEKSGENSACETSENGVSDEAKNDEKQICSENKKENTNVENVENVVANAVAKERTDVEVCGQACGEKENSVQTAQTDTVKTQNATQNSERVATEGIEERKQKIKKNEICVLEKLGDGLYKVRGATTLWSAGVKGNSVLACAYCANKDHKIVVDPNLKSPNFKNVYVVGDSALAVTRDAFHAPTAQLAEQMGAYVAKSLQAELRGKKLGKPFKFFNKGTVCSIGHTDAVGVAFGVSVCGEVGAFLKNFIENKWLFSLGGLKMVLKKGQFRFRSSD